MDAPPGLTVVTLFGGGLQVSIRVYGIITPSGGEMIVIYTKDKRFSVEFINGEDIGSLFAEGMDPELDYVVLFARTPHLGYMAERAIPSDEAVKLLFPEIKDDPKG